MTSILLVDDHAIVRSGIRKLLAGLSPALFMGNPAGTVVIMESKVVDAGGDPEEVLAGAVTIAPAGSRPDLPALVIDRVG